jgi:hypothetical protein
MKWILKGICVAAVVTLAVLGFGYITMHLWNWVIPGLTGWHTLDWCHAIGLLILCKILFGGFRKGGRCGCGRGGWRHKRHGMWRKRWEEKMANMTPEEREKMKKAWGKCGWGDDDCEVEEKKEGDSKI